MRRAVFFDRDGILNKQVNYADWGLDSPARPQDLVLYPDAGRAVRTVQGWGFLAVLVSNQPGIAKGKYSPTDFQEIDHTLGRLLSSVGARLDGRFYCLHHPEALVAEYRQVCGCRKPKPGLLQRAARELHLDLAGSYLIGDTTRDVCAAEAAGCQPLLVKRGTTVGDPISGSLVTLRDLDEALEYIGRREGRYVA